MLSCVGRFLSADSANIYIFSQSMLNGIFFFIYRAHLIEFQRFVATQGIEIKFHSTPHSPRRLTW